MALNYSLRGPLPLLLLSLQVIFILLFLFLISEDYKNDREDPKHYSAFQDVNVMILLGFGFLFASLKKFGFSGVGFNFLIVAFGVQWAIILNTFLSDQQNGVRAVGLSSLCTGLMSVMPVIISSGAVLGKINPLQLLLLTAIEIPVFTGNRYFMTKYLLIQEHISMMHAHLFGAYFGLAVSWLISSPSQSNIANREKEKSDKNSELFSMLGTLFIWVYWPSYNSVLLRNSQQIRNAVYNTYFALAVSTVTAFSVSILFSRKGKFKMSHVRNGVLAGGVSVGFTAFMVQCPWIAMTIGLLAGLISTSCQPYLQKTLNGFPLVHDTCGVHCTFGLPGLLGGIAYSILIISVDYNSIGILGYQAIVGVGCILLTLALSLVSGLFTGFLLKCKLFRPPKEHNFFHDQPFWEFPNLASHF
ncbi:RH-like protein [Pelodytes ibericus]